MFTTAVSIGDTATASQYNNLRKDAGLFSGDSVSFTYNSNGTIATVVHNDFSITETITYNSDGTVDSVGDGTNTWNFSYNSLGQLSTIIKA